MNMKKTLFLATLGIAANLYAQEATIANEPAAAPETAAEVPAAQPQEVAQPVETENATSTEIIDSNTAPVAENEKVEEAAAPENAAIAENPAVAETAVTAAADTVAATTAETAGTPAANEIHETAFTPDTANAAIQTVSAVNTAAVDTVSATPSEESPKNAEAVPSKGPLDVLHADVYNTVGNEAAAATIGGNLATPRKMYGVKGLYLEPVNEKGVLSFGNTNTYFVAFDNSQSLGVLTAGMAFSKFGVSVDGSLGKNWSDTEYPDGYEQNQKVTFGGSTVGLNASVLLGSVDLVASGHYSKPVAENYSKDSYNKWEQKINEYSGKISAAYSGESVSWSVGVEGLRHSFTTETKISVEDVIKGDKHLVTTKTIVSDTSSRFEIKPNFNIGAAVLSAEDAKIYLGVNTRFPVTIYDEIENIMDSRVRFSAFVTPNIFGEVALSKYMMVFGGANLDWNAFSYEKAEVNDLSITNKSTISNVTTVNVGSRFQYSRLAVELAFTKQFLENPFGSFSSTDGVAIDLGMFVNF